MRRRGPEREGVGELQLARGRVFGRTRSLGILLACLALSPAQAAGGEAASSVPQPYAELPLTFEANHGQWNSDAKFAARGDGYTVFLAGSEVVLMLRKPPAARNLKSEMRNLKIEKRNWKLETGNSKSEKRKTAIETCQSEIQNPKPKIPNPASAPSSVLRLSFPGANPNARVIGLAELPGKAHYFIGRNPRVWRANVPNYARVKYERIFPGIDLVFYGKESGARSQESGEKSGRSRSRRPELEFDFIVAPGAEPGAIRLAVETGNSKLETRESKIENRHSKLGALRSEISNLQSACARPESRAPSPEPRTPSPQSRAPGPQTVRVNKSGDLVIATDSGKIRFRKPMVYQEQLSVVSDQLSVKAGQGRGATDADNPKSKTQNRKFVDARYILRAVENETGKSNNENRNSKFEKPIRQLTDKIGHSPFTIHHSEFEVSFEIASYDRTKPLVIDPVLSYSTYLGGSGFDYAQGIAVDEGGNAYVVGTTNSTDFPLSYPAQAANGGGMCGSGLDVYPCFDVFVAKLNAEGTALVYSTYLGGSGEDYGMGIGVDASGNAYVTGYTNSTDFPLTNPLQPSPGGGYDAFAVKLNPQGSDLAYATYLGGAGDDYAYGIAPANGGDAWLAGFTSSPDFPTTAEAVGRVFRGGPYDAFVSRLDSAGAALVYSTYLGGNGEDYASGVATDASGNAYAAGYTNSADFPVAGAFQNAYAAGVCGVEPSTFPCFDAFVTKLNAEAGTLDYSTYLGGHGSDYANGIAVDGEGSVVVAGTTTSTDFPVTAGVVQRGGGGVSVDAFVTKLSSTGSSAVYSTYLGGLGAEAALDIAVDGAGNAYLAGYNFGGGFPVANPLQTPNGGHFDAFFAKLNAAGTALVFSTYLGGSGQEKGHGIAVDSSGNAYVAGGTFSTDLPVTEGTFQTAYAGGSFEGFVVKATNLGLPVVSPPEISLLFPDQGVGTISPPQAVSIANRGDAELVILSATASGDFAQIHDCPNSLSPGGACALEITFLPTEFGPRFGSVTVEHNAYGSPFIVHLAGDGVAAPALTVSPTALSFGDQPLGTTSAAQTVTLSNAGQAWLSISSIATGNDFAVSHTCAPSIPVGGTCTITVAFVPTVPGAIADAVAIADNAPGSPHMVSLTGTGLGPAVSLSATLLDFGEQLVDTAGAPQVIALTNTGNLPLEIAGITVTGDFTQTSDCAANISPGAACAIQLTFTPIARGQRNSALTIHHNGLSSPTTVTLSGMGVAPVISLSPSDLHFGEQPVGTVSPPQTLTLANAGDAPLNILGIEAAGEFAQTNNCPASVPAGGQCAITVTFTPAISGAHSGMVAISHNPTGESFTVALSGMGTDFSLAASPASATINAGQAAAYSLTLTPIAGFSRRVSLACSGAPQAASCSITPQEVDVDGSGAATARVTITTTGRSIVPPNFGKHEKFPPFPRDAHKLLWLSILMFLALAGWRNLRWRAQIGLGGILLSAGLWAACGGGGSASTPIPRQGTPPGTYTLTVTATSAGMTRSATVTLRVN